MGSRPRILLPIEDRGPLRVMFLITSMPVGGAETLLVSLIHGLDRERFVPLLCCMKQLGPLGEDLAAEIPTFHGMIENKCDFTVIRRLTQLFRQERIDALVTVGAGDKMFWGRIAARLARVPVVISAIHSTGWPDGIGLLNRLPWLTRWTDAFVGVAAAHGRHLTNVEHFPADKVRVIPNGVDTRRFSPERKGAAVRRKLGLDAAAPVVCIVAALRPEKNHELFLRAAACVQREIPAARFLIVGDGPERTRLEALRHELGLDESVRFLGNRADIPEVLAACDVFALTSRNEANPVSILEAMASGKPVVAPRVGSIAESVIDGQTGLLIAAGDVAQVVGAFVQLLNDRNRATVMGAAGRAAVDAHWSLARMVEGYEELITEIYRGKCHGSRATQPSGQPAVEKPVANP